MKNPWFSRPRPRDDAKLRLLVFHHAGGSAAFYHKWHRAMPDWAELILVELPGRGRRFQEPHITNFDELTREVVMQIRLEIQGPMAFFGHSMGSLVAFDAAHEIPGVLGLGVSAFVAPSQANMQARTHLSTLSDDDLVKGISHFAELPKELTREPQIFKMYLDVIRNDLALIESYRSKARPKLEVPTMVFGGRDDRAIPPHKLEDWSALTQVQGPVRFVDGGHFYIATCFPDVISDFLSMIQPLCADK